MSSNSDIVSYTLAAIAVLPAVAAVFSAVMARRARLRVDAAVPPARPERSPLGAMDLYMKGTGGLPPDDAATLEQAQRHATLMTCQTNEYIIGLYESRVLATARHAAAFEG